jgi:hypothetical protein
MLVEETEVTAIEQTVPSPTPGQAIAAVCAPAVVLKRALPLVIVTTIGVPEGIPAVVLIVSAQVNVPKLAVGQFFDAVKVAAPAPGTKVGVPIATAVAGGSVGSLDVIVCDTAPIPVIVKPSPVTVKIVPIGHAAAPVTVMMIVPAAERPFVTVQAGGAGVTVTAPGAVIVALPEDTATVYVVPGGAATVLLKLKLQVAVFVAAPGVHAFTPPVTVMASAGVAVYTAVPKAAASTINAPSQTSLRAFNFPSW